MALGERCIRRSNGLAYQRHCLVERAGDETGPLWDSLGAVQQTSYKLHCCMKLASERHEVGVVRR